MSGSLNQCQFIGRLGADPEVRTFASGGKVVNLRLAVSERWKDKTSGEQKERTEWIPVAIFNEGIGRIAEQYLHKGSLVFVSGQFETRKWQDQQGNDRYTTEITIRPYHGEMKLLGDAGGSGAGHQNRQREDRAAGSGDDNATPGADRRRRDMDDEIPF